jgi:hypothetical protein
MTRLPILCGLALFAGLVPAADPTAPADARGRAEELVRDLGSPAFAERDRATRELRKLGRFALPALSAARRDDNPEVRMRAALLIPVAEADDLRVRLEAFVNDPDDPAGAGLPGWAKFRQVAGDDKPARELFAEVIRNPVNRQLMNVVGGTPADLVPPLAAVVGGPAAAGVDLPPPAAVGRAVVVRRLQLYGQYGPQSFSGSSGGRGPDVSEMAALLLAEGFTVEKLAPQTATQFYTIGVFESALGREAADGSGRFGPAVRRLAFRWLETRDAPASVDAAFRASQRLRLPTAVQARLAARVCSFPGLSWLQRLAAIHALSQTRESEHLPALMRNFTDQSQLNRRGGVQDVLQLRDIALAAAVQITGQDPTDYGFAKGFGVMSGRYGEWGFAEDVGAVSAKRQEAFARWRAWEATVFGGAGGPAAAFAAADGVWPLKVGPNDGP